MSSPLWQLLSKSKTYPLRITVIIASMLTFSLASGLQLGLIEPLFNLIIFAKPLQAESGSGFLSEIISYLFTSIASLLVDFDKIALVCTLVLLIVTIKSLADYCYRYTMSTTSRMIAKDIQDHLFAHILKLPLSAWSQMAPADTVSRLSNDLDIVRRAVGDGLIPCGQSTILLIVYASIALSIDAQLTMITVSILLLMFIPINKIGKSLRRISSDEQNLLSALETILEEVVSGIKVVKAFAMEGYEQDRFAKANHDYYRRQLKFAKRRIALPPLMEIVAVGGIAVILWHGGSRVISGQFTPGTFFLFLGALASLNAPIKKISKVIALIQKGNGASQKLLELSQLPPEATPGLPIIPALKSKISLQNLSFAYQNSETVLHNLNIEIPCQTVTALVGPSGGGKSTLLRLLAGLYQPTGGAIYFDQCNIADYDPESVRQQIGYVTQELQLLHTDCQENVAPGQDNPDPQRITRALQAAKADGFVDQLPYGIDTVIGQCGHTLSGGQRQRLTIARAFYKDPPLLLLDEATSALDNESERAVQESIEKLMQNRTVIVVAHRLSTICNADRILVIDGGKVVESGRHQELLAAQGRYAALYHASGAYSRAEKEQL